MGVSKAGLSYAAIPAYTAIAGKLSNTFGSSSGTQADIPTNGMVGVHIVVTAVNMPAATELRITPVPYDGTTESVPRSDGTNPDFRGMTVAGALPFFPVSSAFLRIEPWLDGADAAATCTIVVYPVY